MSEVMLVIVGMIVGAAVAVALVLLRRHGERRVADAVAEQADKTRAEEIAALTDNLKTQFAALSREALTANADDFLKLARTQLDKQATLAEQNLESKKKLIDQRLETMGTKLTEVGGALQTLDKDRRESQGKLSASLERTTQATTRLHETTAQLREALAHPQRRGQWGERMAEDVLRLAGLLEGVNYRKQEVSPDGGRPDYTFLLPADRKINMDVKFPLANYLKVLDAPDDAARAATTAQFLRDVRARVREVTTREYIDPTKGTVDFVLVFIPNEQIYGFIHEHDNRLLDDAMKSRVVLCSPLTLYAVLAVIRQSAENFRLEQASSRILSLLGDFKKQWDKYVEQMDRMGDRLDGALKAYEQLKGTRTRQLERQLDKIEDLRVDRENLLPAEPDDPVD
jgi:DNA recombination protein RmuC